MVIFFEVLNCRSMLSLNRKRLLRNRIPHPYNPLSFRLAYNRLSIVRSPQKNRHPNLDAFEAVAGFVISYPAVLSPRQIISLCLIRFHGKCLLCIAVLRCPAAHSRVTRRFSTIGITALHGFCAISFEPMCFFWGEYKSPELFLRKESPFNMGFHSFAINSFQLIACLFSSLPVRLALLFHLRQNN